MLLLPDLGGPWRRGSRSRLALALLSACLVAACAAASRDGESEISRDRAIEIARQHLEFEAKSVEAVRATDEGRPVWEVTFRGEDIGPGRPIGEVLIVLVDRKTGEVVSIGRT